jgi:hypothetical protein
MSRPGWRARWFLPGRLRPGRDNGRRPDRYRPAGGGIRRDAAAGRNGARAARRPHGVEIWSYRLALTASWAATRGREQEWPRTPRAGANEPWVILAGYALLTRAPSCCGSPTRRSRRRTHQAMGVSSGGGR